MLEWWGQCAEAEGMHSEYEALAGLQLIGGQKKKWFKSFERKSTRPLSYRYPHPCSRGDVAMLTPQNSTYSIHPGTAHVPKS